MLESRCTACPPATRRLMPFNRNFALQHRCGHIAAPRGCGAAAITRPERTPVHPPDRSARQPEDLNTGDIAISPPCRDRAQFRSAITSPQLTRQTRAIFSRITTGPSFVNHVIASLANARLKRPGARGTCDFGKAAFRTVWHHWCADGLHGPSARPPITDATGSRPWPRPLAASLHRRCRFDREAPVEYTAPSPCRERPWPQAAVVGSESRFQVLDDLFPQYVEELVGRDHDRAAVAGEA